MKKITLPSLACQQQSESEPDGKTALGVLHFDHQTDQYLVGIDQNGKQRWLPRAHVLWLHINSITDQLTVRMPLRELERRGLVLC